jgi:hypothetical protein
VNEFNHDSLLIFPSLQKFYTPASECQMLNANLNPVLNQAVVQTENIEIRGSVVSNKLKSKTTLLTILWIKLTGQILKCSNIV